VGLHPIVLVHERLNALVPECAKGRADLRRRAPGTPWSEIEETLSADYARRFKERPQHDDPEWGEGFGRDLPRLQRLVDELRKGHADNWAHLSWDGTDTGAWQIISARLGATFSAYRTAWIQRRRR
jgi:hypothetical protein